MYPIQALTAAMLLTAPGSTTTVLALVGRRIAPTWCLYMHYPGGPINRQILPIYFGTEVVVTRLQNLLADRVLPWHAIQLLPPRRGRPSIPQLGCAEVQTSESEVLVAEVNARFPLLALHVYQVTARKLSQILDVPPVGRKTVRMTYAGMFREPIPARLSRGFRPIAVKR